MPFLSRPVRPRRAGEWSEGACVTFLVTLAATGRVTLAARAAGFSRKAAYALRGRSAAFEGGWNLAIAAHRARTADHRAEGDEVDEGHNPRNRPVEGNRAGPSTSAREPSRRPLSWAAESRQAMRLAAWDALA